MIWGVYLRDIFMFDVVGFKEVLAVRRNKIIFFIWNSFFTVTFLRDSKATNHYLNAIDVLSYLKTQLIERNEARGAVSPPFLEHIHSVGNHAQSSGEVTLISQ